jgi:tripartite-type tricarboxylate transporter receptor subunit TctC
MKRRTALAAFPALAASALPAFSQIADSRPIRIVLPAPAGGPIDAQARALAQELAKLLETSVVVDNKPGAATLLGSAEVARAAADGRTLLYTTDQSVTQAPHTLIKPPFDAQKDLTPVMRTALLTFVLLTHPSVPGHSVAELVAYARQNPGKLSYASYGAGSPPHVFGEMLAKVANIDVTHIPYKGVADAVADMISGRVQFTFNSPALVSQYVTTGKLKVIGATGERRSRLLPEVPTMLEQGFAGFETTSWVALFVPAGARGDTVQRLRDAVAVALRQPAIAALWRQQAFDFPPQDETLAQARQILQRDYAKWGGFIRDVGVQPQ